MGGENFRVAGFVEQGVQPFLNSVARRRSRHRQTHGDGVIRHLAIVAAPDAEFEKLRHGGGPFEPEGVDASLFQHSQ